jgi:hypothetical protein
MTRPTSIGTANSPMNGTGWQTKNSINIVAQNKSDNDDHRLVDANVGKTI